MSAVRLYTDKNRTQGENESTNREVRMVRLGDVEKQLKRIGVNFQYWGRAEKRELCNILTDNEQIVAAVNGRYEGGFAMLVATNQRLLLVDKKIWFLTVEDVRYDMIAEVDYSARLIEAILHVMTFNKTLIFRTTNKRHLRPLTNYVQQRVMELRQHGYSEQMQLSRAAIPAAVQPHEAYGMSPAVTAEATQPHTMHVDETFGAQPAQADDVQQGVVDGSEFDRPFLPRIRSSNPYTKSAFMMRKRFSRF